MDSFVLGQCHSLFYMYGLQVTSRPLLIGFCKLTAIQNYFILSVLDGRFRILPTKRYPNALRKRPSASRARRIPGPSYHGLL